MSAAPAPAVEGGRRFQASLIRAAGRGGNLAKGSGLSHQRQGHAAYLAFFHGSDTVISSDTGTATVRTEDVEGHREEHTFLVEEWPGRAQPTLPGAFKAARPSEADESVERDKKNQPLKQPVTRPETSTSKRKPQGVEESKEARDSRQDNNKGEGKEDPASIASNDTRTPAAKTATQTQPGRSSSPDDIPYLALPSHLVQPPSFRKQMAERPLPTMTITKSKTTAAAAAEQRATPAEEEEEPRAAAATTAPPPSPQHPPSAIDPPPLSFLPFRTRRPAAPITNVQPHPFRQGASARLSSNPKLTTTYIYPGDEAEENERLRCLLAEEVNQEAERLLQTSLCQDQGQGHLFGRIEDVVHQSQDFGAPKREDALRSSVSVSRPASDPASVAFFIRTLHRGTNLYIKERYFADTRHPLYESFEHTSQRGLWRTEVLRDALDRGLPHAVGRLEGIILGGGDCK